MALRNIVKQGDECLQKVCRPVTEFNSRLHTLLERILNDIAFNAGGGDAPEVKVTIDAEYVQNMLGADIHRKDVRKYIL